MIYVPMRSAVFHLPLLQTPVRRMKDRARDVPTPRPETCRQPANRRNRLRFRELRAATTPSGNGLSGADCPTPSVAATSA